MLRIDSRNINFNAVSLINNSTVATYNASVNDPDNNAYINISINDMATVRNNLVTIKTDLDEFIDEISESDAEDE